MLAQKEELERREAGRREEQDKARREDPNPNPSPSPSPSPSPNKARREAEAELRAAMPGLLTSAEPHRLQAAVDAAKLAGVP